MDYIWDVKSYWKNAQNTLQMDFCNSFKIQDFIRHIHNYTEYNQQWNVSQVCSMDIAIICNKHKRIYINIGMKKMK